MRRKRRKPPPKPIPPKQYARYMRGRFSRAAAIRTAPRKRLMARLKAQQKRALRRIKKR